MANPISSRVVVSADSSASLETDATYTCEQFTGNGGAVYVNSGATLTGSNNTFSGNSATGSGGAIYNSAGTVTLFDASFVSNSATSHGGAICNNNGIVTLSGDASFTGNSAFYGTIINYSGGTVEFAGSSATFSGNLAKYNGAIYNRGGIVTLSGDASFTGNSAGEGAAIDNNKGTVTVSGDATFSGNSALSGGAIFNTSKGTVALSGDAYFVSNFANKGGAVYNFFSGTSATFANATFIGNSGVSGGAVFNASNGTIAFTGSSATFSGNSGVRGGAIYNLNGMPTISGDAFFVSNTAATNGGAIFTAVSAFTFAGSSATFIGNSAEQGGAIYNSKGSLTFNDVAFSNNAATTFFGGAIFNLYNGTVTVSGDASFVSNTAATNGGAICNSTGTVTLSGDASFVGNSAAALGGAIYFGAGTLNLADATFSGNTAADGGGAICNVSATVNLKGAIALETDTDTVVNSKTVNWDLTGGLAKYGSIAGYQRLTNSGTLTITVSATQETGSYVMATGNFDDVTDKNTFTITGVSGQEDATITIGGDAVEYNGATYTLAVKDTSNLVLAVYDKRIVVSAGSSYALSDGKSYTAAPYAGNGGAVYVDADGTVTGTNVTFAGNTATNGGAIYNQGGTVNMKGAVTLATASDDIYNNGVLNWDLTGGTASYGSIAGYQYVKNVGGTLAITVNANDVVGNEYVIATGDLSVLTGKDAFSLKNADTVDEEAITVNGGAVSYNSRGYKLATRGTGANAELVLSVVQCYTLWLDGGTAYKDYVFEGQEIDLEKTFGKTLTVSGSQESGYVWTMEDFNFATAADVAMMINGNTAITVKGENSISGGDAMGCVGLRIGGDVTIQGDGALSIQAGNCTDTLDSIGLQISDSENSLTVKDSAKVTISAGTTSGGGTSYGVHGATEPTACAQWDGKVPKWQDDHYEFRDEEAGSITIADNVILTKPFDSRIVVEGGSVETLTDGKTYTAAPYSGKGGAIYNGGTVSFTGTSVSFTGNSAQDGGAIYNGGTVTLSGDATFNGNTAFSGGAICNNNDATITLSSATFTGNTASHGGAIYNQGGTVNMKGAVTLATDSDDIYNMGVLNWDITGDTDSYGSVVNYQYLNSSGGTLTITVTATQPIGNYVIATGNFADIANKDTFIVKTAEDATGAAVKIKGAAVGYGQLFYSLTIDDNGTQEIPDDDKLILNAEDGGTVIEVTKAAGYGPIDDFLVYSREAWPLGGVDRGSVFASAFFGGTVSAGSGLLASPTIAL